MLNNKYFLIKILSSTSLKNKLKIFVDLLFYTLNPTVAITNWTLFKFFLCMYFNVYFCHSIIPSSYFKLHTLLSFLFLFKCFYHPWKAAVAAHSVVKSSLHASRCMFFICPVFPPFSHLSFSSPFLTPVFPFLLPGNLLPPVDIKQFVSILCTKLFFYFQTYLRNVEEGAGSEDLCSYVLSYVWALHRYTRMLQGRKETWSGAIFIDGRRFAGGTFFFPERSLKCFSRLTAGWWAQTEPEGHHAAEIPAAGWGECHAGCG